MSHRVRTVRHALSEQRIMQFIGYCLCIFIAVFCHAHPLTDNDMAVEIHAMFSKDQQARRNQDRAAIRAIDAENAPKIIAIIDNEGIPKISAIGDIAAGHFVNLVLHLDMQYLSYQQKVLDALAQYVKEGEARISNYAYLYDRVQVRRGRPQKWGTQGRCVGKHWVMYAVENKAILDWRRHQIGLPKIEDYRALLASQHGCGW